MAAKTAAKVERRAKRQSSSASGASGSSDSTTGCYYGALAGSTGGLHGSGK